MNSRLRVTMTVSNRPHYLERTLASWSKVRGIQDVSFSFHVEPSKSLEQNLAIITGFQGRTGVQGTVTVNEKRLGVLTNPWTAFEGGFLDGHYFVVLTDEDVLVSTDVLEFYQYAAQTFIRSYKVLGVCACNQIRTAYPDSLPYGTRLQSYFTPVSFGIWLDRWTDVFRNTWDFDYSTGNPDGSEAGFDWNISRILRREEAKFLFPDESRADHIGEVGAHMRAEDFAESQAPTFVRERPPGEYTLPYRRSSGRDIFS